LEKRGLSLRYGGSFVGDYNQVLMKGGFFAYPELSDAPKGKYRLQFESNPIGFITELAGGRASDGINRILDVTPTSISQRVPTYVGNSNLVAEFETIYRTAR
jgi:fructose-1,6-bisphosphatase I